MSRKVFLDDRERKSGNGGGGWECKKEIKREDCGDKAKKDIQAHG